MFALQLTCHCEYRSKLQDLLWGGSTHWIVDEMQGRRYLENATTGLRRDHMIDKVAPKSSGGPTAAIGSGGEGGNEVTKRPLKDVTKKCDLKM
jgi:hypothetical protein